MKNLSIFIFSLFLSISSVAQHWNTTGNNSLNPSTNFIGNTDAVDMRFRTSNNNRMVLTGDKGWLGLHTMSPTAPMDVRDGNVIFWNSDDNILINWPPGPLQTVPVDGIGMRMMWLDSVGAFRAGMNGLASIAIPYWDADHIGVGSIAMGIDVAAIGLGSIAIGNQSVSRYLRSVAIGHHNDADAADSYILGEQNIIYENHAMALGFWNTVDAFESVALGRGNTVDGDWNYAIGFGNQMEGEKSVSIGIENTAEEFCSTAIGSAVHTEADFAMAIGHGADLGTPLYNNIEHSIMLGANSTVPTIFIEDSGGAGLFGNVGFGNITAPTHLIDANGNARFRQMPSTTGNVLITGVQESGAGDYSLSTKPFGSAGQYLDGTGAWVNMPPAEQCDWNLNGQDIIMGYAGSTPVAAFRSGNVGIGTHVPTGGKLTVQHTNGTSVYARMGGTAASINSMHAKTSVGANSQESVAVRADNSLNTSCSSPYTASVAYGLKAYANNGEKNFAV